MAKTKTKLRTKRAEAVDYDGVYLLKIMLYIVLGSLWIKFIPDATPINLPLPIGFAVGVILASHEHFRLDRKIEYAVLLVAMFVGYFAPFGLYFEL